MGAVGAPGAIPGLACTRWSESGQISAWFRLFAEGSAWGGWKTAGGLTANICPLSTDRCQLSAPYSRASSASNSARRCSQDVHPSINSTTRGYAVTRPTARTR